MAAGFAVISDLYVGGVEGYTGGVICGGVALLLRWLCGTPISYILLGILAVFTLLGAMQITLPSIIRAIANRPRDDFQEDGDDSYIEPAAIVVNKIATHQIEQKRKRREQARQAPAPAVNSPAQRAAVPAAKPVQVECEPEMPVKKPARETAAQQEEKYAGFYQLGRMAEMIFEEDWRDTDEKAKTQMLERESAALMLERITSVLSRQEYAVLLRYLDGLPYATIATQLQITAKAVDNALQRARAKLRSLL